MQVPHRPLRTQAKPFEQKLPPLHHHYYYHLLCFLCPLVDWLVDRLQKNNIREETIKEKSSSNACFFFFCYLFLLARREKRRKGESKLKKKKKNSIGREAPSMRERYSTGFWLGNRRKEWEEEEENEWMVSLPIGPLVSQIVGFLRQHHQQQKQKKKEEKERERDCSPWQN